MKKRSSYRGWRITLQQEIHQKHPVSWADRSNKKVLTQISVYCMCTLVFVFHFVRLQFDQRTNPLEKNTPALFFSTFGYLPFFLSPGHTANKKKDFSSSSCVERRKKQWGIRKRSHTAMDGWTLYVGILKIPALKRLSRWEKVWNFFSTVLQVHLSRLSPSVCVSWWTRHMFPKWSVSERNINMFEKVVMLGLLNIFSKKILYQRTVIMADGSILSVCVCSDQASDINSPCCTLCTYLCPRKHMHIQVCKYSWYTLRLLRSQVAFTCMSKHRPQLIQHSVTQVLGWKIWPRLLPKEIHAYYMETHVHK